MLLFIDIKTNVRSCKKYEEANYMKKVFVTRKIPNNGIEFLRQNGFQVDYWNQSKPIDTEQLYKKSLESDALITMLSDKIDQEFLNSNKHLKVISNFAVGLNNIDLKTARELNIIIGNTPDVLTEASAEMAFLLMLAVARNFHSALKNASSGQWKSWEPMGFLGHGMKGKTVGIIGQGRIGKRFAEMCKSAFQMKVVFYQRETPLEDFLRPLDVLSLHVPLTKETHSMITIKHFDVMKSELIFVNTARGEVVDQVALTQALKDKKIFGAGLDVTSPEPLDHQHELFLMDNVLITPHIASATFKAREEMSMLCAQNIIQAFK